GRRDDQRLVERALRDRVRRQTAAGVRVEVLREGGIARAGHDEALVTGTREVGRRRNCCAAHQRRDGGESRDRGGECERTFWEAASHRLSFLARTRAIHTCIRPELPETFPELLPGRTGRVKRVFPADLGVDPNGLPKRSGKCFNKRPW